MRVSWTTDTVTTDVSRALHYTLLWGLDGVVLRAVGPGRVPDVNEGPLRRRLEDDDVPVFAVDPGVLEGDLRARASWMNEIAAFDDTVAFCRRFGVGAVQVGALASGDGPYDVAAAAAAVRQLGDVSARSGLRLAVRNEGGTQVSTGAALSELVEAVDHPSVLADWRPLDALRAGEPPEVGLDALTPARIEVLTVRDAGPEGEPAVPGQGRLDWDAILSRLRAGSWDGLVNLEVRGRPAGAFGLHSASAMISAVRRATQAE